MTIARYCSDRSSCLIVITAKPNRFALSLYQLRVALVGFVGG
jgi:hypothetical protein